MTRKPYAQLTLAAVIAACGSAPEAGDPAPALAHYDIRAELDPASAGLEAALELTFTAPDGAPATIDFLLHRELEVRGVLGAGVAGYRFAPLPEGPPIYSPEAYRLSVDFEAPLRPGAAVRLAFAYGGSITGWPEYLPNVMTPEWVELGLYFPWFPLREGDSGQFTYRLDIGCPSPYALATAVPAQRENERWIFNERRPARDIVVVASPRLVTRAVERDGFAIMIHSVSLREETAALIAEDLSRILGLFGERFGAVESASLTLIQSPRARGGGYSRGNLVVLGGLADDDYSARREGYIRYLAHEAAHAWWWRAPVDTWEDWLNEGLAEYSALLAVRETIGREAFDERLERKKEQSATAGALWGFDRGDRSSEEALQRTSVLLYSKAPVLLFELEKRLGGGKMRDLCRALVREEVASTAGFLDLLARHAGVAEREWFKERLKR